MIVRLLYGGNRLEIAVPDSLEVDTFEVTGPESYIDSAGFRQRFTEAGGGQLLPGERLLIVVNDAYRHTPTETVLEHLASLDPSFVNKASILIATGAHKAGTDSDLTTILGRFRDSLASRVFWHDATDQTSMTEIGRDKFDQPVFLNNQLLQAENVLIIGSVEPHYFAGYTGGRKSIFPGLCDLATIERNHNLANSLDAQPLRLTGNPVAEHLTELLYLSGLEKLFTIQVLADQDGRLIDLFCGPLETAFGQAVDAAQAVYTKTFTRQYDLLLAELRPPLDRNLYQIQKSLENTQHAVKDGGSIVLFSACHEGIGSNSFYEQALSWDRKKNEPANGEFKFGSHKLTRVNAIGQRINIGVHSTLSADQLRQVFYEPVEDIEAHIRDREINGARTLAIVHDAGHTVLQRIN